MAELVIEFFRHLSPYAGMLAIVLWGLRRIEKKIDKFGMEHELLVRDYCERHGIKVEDLPTRMKRLLA